MGQLKASFLLKTSANPSPQDLIEDLDDLPLLSISPIRQALIFVAGSLGFMALASLALWSGFQYEANRRPAAVQSLVPDPPRVLEAPPDTGVAITSEPSKAAKTRLEEAPLSDVAPPEEVAAVPLAPPTIPDAPTADLPAAIRLVGVITESDSSLQALLMVNNILLPLGSGESIDRGWYVTSVQREHVVLSNGYRSHTLQLGLTGQL